MDEERGDDVDAAWGPLGELLGSARRTARKRRLVLSGPPLALGLLLVAAGGVTLYSSANAIASATWQAGVMMLVAGFPLVLLGLLPSDTRLIQAAGAVIAASALALTVWAVRFADAFASVGFRAPACSATDVIYSDFVLWQALAVAYALTAVYIAQGVVQALRGRLWSSALLQRLHRAIALNYLFFGLLLVWVTVHLTVRSPPVFHTVHWVGNVLTCALVTAIGALQLLTDVRARVHSWLAARGELMSSSASIAAILHGASIEAVLRSAASRMRGVRADKLDPSVFAPERAHNLRALSAPAGFASVDAFISHSHLDEPAPKWAALQAWRRRFVRAHGREPVVWIDTCCVESARAAVDVGNLPCYIAGCNEFVILAGPTFLRRLWATVEVFCRTRMGAAADTITLYELPGFERERDSASYDVRACTCTYRDDYFALLACIESACDGGLEAFNREMRALLLSARAHRAPPVGGEGLEGFDDLHELGGWPQVVLDVAIAGGVAQSAARAAGRAPPPPHTPAPRAGAMDAAEGAGGTRSAQVSPASPTIGAGGIELAPLSPAHSDDDGSGRSSGRRVPHHVPGPAHDSEAALQELSEGLARASRALNAAPHARGPSTAYSPRAAGRPWRIHARVCGAALALAVAYAIAVSTVVAWASAPAEADCAACAALLDEQLPRGGVRAGEWLGPAFANGTSEYLFSGLGGSARPGQSSWGGALEACRAEGGALVAVGSATEDRFVYCAQRLAAMGSWIGYSRRPRGAEAAGAGGWAWAAGAPVGHGAGAAAGYANWAADEPARAGGECAITGGTVGGWSAVPCAAAEATATTLHAYVCERRARGHE